MLIVIFVEQILHFKVIHYHWALTIDIISHLGHMKNMDIFSYTKYK